MRTLMIFVFYGGLMILLCCAEAAKAILSMTRPALVRARRGPRLMQGYAASH